MFENNLFFREDESSIYTVIIYLNSDFEGGGTNFLHEGGDQVLIPSAMVSFFDRHFLERESGMQR